VIACSWWCCFRVRPLFLWAEHWSCSKCTYLFWKAVFLSKEINHFLSNLPLSHGLIMICCHKDGAWNFSINVISQIFWQWKDKVLFPVISSVFQVAALCEVSYENCVHISCHIWATHVACHDVRYFTTLTTWGNHDCYMMLFVYSKEWAVPCSFALHCR
jgi:hypothetical protein